MSHDRDASIRAIAHRLWEEEGRPDGRDLEIWVRAEKLESGKTKPVTASKAAPAGTKKPAAEKKPAAKKAPAKAK